MHEYARLIDLAQFDDVAALFAAGEWFGLEGADAVRAWFADNVILYDGSPRTQHVVSNVDVRVDDDRRTAQAHSYITVFQQVEPGGPIVAITANYYVDSFARRDGQWSFAKRSIHRRLVGDATSHRRA